MNRPTNHHEWLPVAVTAAPFALQWVAAALYAHSKAREERDDAPANDWKPHPQK